MELEEGHPTCGSPGGCRAAPAFRDHPSPSKVREVLVDEHNCGSGPTCNGPGLSAGSVRAPGAEPVLTALGGPTAALGCRGGCGSPRGKAGCCHHIGAQGLSSKTSVVSRPPATCHGGENTARVSPGGTRDDGSFAVTEGSSDIPSHWKSWYPAVFRAQFYTLTSGPP